MVMQCRKKFIMLKEEENNVNTSPNDSGKGIKYWKGRLII